MKAIIFNRKKLKRKGTRGKSKNDLKWTLFRHWRKMRNL